MVQQLGECMFILEGWAEVPIWHDKIQEDGAALDSDGGEGARTFLWLGPKPGIELRSLTTPREVFGVHTVCV